MAVSEELATYVSSQQLAGMSDDAIRAALLSAGWKNEDIETLLPIETGSILAVPPPRPKPNIRLLAGISVLAVLVAVGASALVWQRPTRNSSNAQVSSPRAVPTPSIITGSWIQGVSIRIPGGYQLLSMPDGRRAIVKSSSYERLVFRLQEENGTSTVTNLLLNDEEALAWVISTPNNLTDTETQLKKSIEAATDARVIDDLTFTNSVVNSINVPYRFGQPLVGEITSSNDLPKRLTWEARTRSYIPAATVIFIETTTGTASLTLPMLGGRTSLTPDQREILAGISLTSQ